MPKIKTILAPVDFSERTDAEIKQAAALARRFAAKLLLLHVIPNVGRLNPADPAAAKAYDEDFDADVQTGIKKALVDLGTRAAPGVETEPLVIVGDATAEIEGVAKQRHIDLMVLSPAHSSRLWRNLKGSIALKTLEDLACPILLTVDTESEDPNYATVGCMVDFRDGGERLLRWADDLATSIGAKLKVFYVISIIPGGGAPAPSEDQIEVKKAEMLAEVERMVAREAINAEAFVVAGDSLEVLPPALAQAGVDVLVTGRRANEEVVGAFGLHRDLVDVAERSPCPILSI